MATSERKNGGVALPESSGRRSCFWDLLSYLQQHSQGEAWGLETGREADSRGRKSLRLLFETVFRESWGTMQRLRSEIL